MRVFRGETLHARRTPYSWLASYLGSDSGTATGSASNTSMPAEMLFVKMSILSSHLGRTVNIPEKHAGAPGTRKSLSENRKEVIEWRRGTEVEQGAEEQSDKLL
jgi:hypothetical protein